MSSFSYFDEWIFWHKMLSHNTLFGVSQQHVAKTIKEESQNVVGRLTIA